MLQPTVCSFQPFIDYAPPVRAGRQLSQRERWAASLRRLATGAVLLATAVGAFALAHVYGLGGAGALLAALVLSALAARGGLPLVRRTLGRLLRAINILWLVLSGAILITLALDHARDPATGMALNGGVLLMLALMCGMLELLRALMLWALGDRDSLIPSLWREARSSWLRWEWSSPIDDGFIKSDPMEDYENYSFLGKHCLVNIHHSVRR